jgi:phosphohistidine phosphatase
MDIYLIRHGDTVAPANRQDNPQRPLTAEGVAKLKRQAKTLAQWKLPIDTLVSSPFVRARQTADIVAEALHLPVIEDALLTRTQFGLEQLDQLIAKYPQAKHLMLAGHEPDFSKIMSAVIGGGSLQIDHGGIGRIALKTLHPPSGTLLWLLTPDVMGAEPPGPDDS